jgi:hypothetical protein
MRSEAPGRSKCTANTGNYSNAGTFAADLTEDELEQILAQKRLAKEGSSNNTINATSEGRAGAVGGGGQD